MTSCAATSPTASPPGSSQKPALRLEAPERPFGLKLLGSRRMPGLVADLHVSANGKNWVAAWIPDDRQPGNPRYGLASYETSGKLRWKKPLKSQVRTLGTSRDGDLTVYGNYDEELIALNGTGKPLWKAHVICKPIVLSRAKQVICYHDDDAEPQVAFDVFDWSGKKLSSYPVRSDILALKVSPDERWIALALNGGEAVVLNERFEVVWKAKLPGEILDLTVASTRTAEGELQPRAAALLRASSKQSPSGQSLQILGPKGTVELRQDLPAGSSEQVELTPDADRVLTYGNGTRGQRLTMFRIQKDRLEEGWARGDDRSSEYSASLIVSPAFAATIFENFEARADSGSRGASKRNVAVMGFDWEGKQLWNLPLQTEEGGYLYTQSLSAEGGILLLGTDDAVLRIYQLAAGKR